MLEKLREKVGANSRVLEGNMDAIMSALRPSQQAKFLVWIENNQTCMMMLNSLWGQLEDHNASESGAPAGSTSGGVNGVPILSRGSTSAGHRSYGAFVPAKYDLTCGALGVGPLEDVGATTRINGFTGEKLSTSTTTSSTGVNVGATSAAAASTIAGGAKGGASLPGQERKR